MRASANAGSLSSQPAVGPVRRHPFSSISFDEQTVGSLAVERSDKGAPPGVGSFSASAAPRAGLPTSSNESDIAVGARDTADPAFSKLLRRYDALVGKRGIFASDPYPAVANFKFGSVREGQVHFSVDIPLATAGAVGCLQPRPCARIFQPCSAMGPWTPWKAGWTSRGNGGASRNKVLIRRVTFWMWPPSKEAAPRRLATA